MPLYQIKLKKKQVTKSTHLNETRREALLEINYKKKRINI
jgi:hypothetical protein